jgi:predicted dehydrogenase
VGDIASVTADLTQFVDRPAAGGDPYLPENDSALVAMRFENGAHGTLAANVVAHQAERLQSNTIVLQGEGGTLELHHTFAGASLRGARDSEKTFNEIEIPADIWAGVDPSEPNTAGQHHSVGDRAFIDAIIAGGTVEPSFYDGWQVQRVIEAAFESKKTRSWQQVAKGMDE